MESIKLLCKVYVRDKWLDCLLSECTSAGDSDRAAISRNPQLIFSWMNGTIRLSLAEYNSVSCRIVLKKQGGIGRV